MKISLLTDAPKHNLALMKLSAYHKKMGDQVTLNMPIVRADFTYASVLFDWNLKKFIADEYGGPAFEGSITHVDSIFPDYDLYGLDFSLGYTFRPCYNSCDFCKVPKMEHPDTEHHSIWEFHDSKFKKICLLNNNTFQDPNWLDTFEEIWDANLTVIDENGYDLRLLDSEKAWALAKTKFDKMLHFAWDRMQDESLILHGLKMLQWVGIRQQRVYVLVGHNTSEQDDIYRCQKIIEHDQIPYIMPYKRTKRIRQFKRFIDTFMWRKYKTVANAWKDYK